MCRALQTLLAAGAAAEVDKLMETKFRDKLSEHEYEKKRKEQQELAIAHAHRQADVTFGPGQTYQGQTYRAPYVTEEVIVEEEEPPQLYSEEFIVGAHSEYGHRYGAEPHHHHGHGR